MARILARLLSAAVALLVPALLLVAGVRLVAADWYVRFLYERGGVPPDRYGLSDAQRVELALLGLHAILPGDEPGIEGLRRARLPGGAPAFDARELRHMADVRALVGRAFRFQVAAGAAVVALALLTAPVRRLRPAVPRGLRLGAWLTIALAALVGALSLLSWDSFSTPFHAVFFAGDSWRFADGDTLRRLYPDQFWVDTALALGLLAVAQALILLALLRLGRLLLRAGALLPLRQA